MDTCGWVKLEHPYMKKEAEKVVYGLENGQKQMDMPVDWQFWPDELRALETYLKKDGINLESVKAFSKDQVAQKNGQKIHLNVYTGN